MFLKSKLYAAAFLTLASASAMATSAEAAQIHRDRCDPAFSWYCGSQYPTVASRARPLTIEQVGRVDAREQAMSNAGGGGGGGGGR